MGGAKLTSNQAANLASGLTTGLSGGDSFPVTSGAVAWWDPTRDDLMVMATGVSSYADAIGGVTFTEGTGSQQPTLVQSAETGHQMLSGTVAASTAMDVTNSLAEVFEAPHSIIAEVVDSGTSSARRSIVLAGNAGSTEYAYLKVGSNVGGDGATYRIKGAVIDIRAKDTTAISDSTASWVYGSQDASTAYAMMKGGALTSQALGGAVSTGLTKLTLFGAFGLEFDGYIGHIIIWNRVLTAAERNNAIAWIESR